MQTNQGQKPRQSFRPHACLRCGGDVLFDRGGEAEWRCMQCGRTLVPYSPAAAESRDIAELASPQAWDRIARNL